MTAKHKQWTTVDERIAVVGKRIDTIPLVEVEDEDGDGVAYTHPHAGSDWTASIIEVGSHAGGSMYHVRIKYRSVPAMTAPELEHLRQYGALGLVAK